MAKAARRRRRRGTIAIEESSYAPVGTPPGVLPAHPPGGEAAVHQIHMIDYNTTDYQERTGVALEECLAYIDHPTVTWIHVQGTPDTALLERMRGRFSLHPLALEDVLYSGQRPKVEYYDQQLFMIFALASSQEGELHTDQLCMFVAGKCLISFFNGNLDPLETLRNRLRTHAGRIRDAGVDYLMYAIVDVAVDNNFPVLESIGEEIEELEVKVLEAPGQELLRRMQRMKRDLLLLRRFLWPQREILGALMRDEHALITPSTKLYLRDCYDHTIQTMDLLESYRDMITNMMEVYLSSVSLRLNEIMRVLTLISTIFIPLTFVVGVYGMNFNQPDNPWAMPEVHWKYSYPVLWAVMLCIAGGMVLLFRKKKWL
jgi:magnesium transporter